MKFEIEIDDEVLRMALQGAACDYVYDRAKQIVNVAMDEQIGYQDKLKYELFNEIQEAVARRLGVEVK